MKVYEATKDHFTTGLFLKNPVKKVSGPFPPTSHLYLTQKDIPAIRRELGDLIRNAEVVIKVCSFIITDPQVFELLLSRAKEKKIAIFLLTQLDNSKLINTSEDIDLNNADEQATLHLHHIKKLYDHGVHVRAATTAHAKFVIADRSRGFLTSANLTVPSLDLNMESGIYLNREDSIQLDALFDLIYQKGTQYRHYISASKHKSLVVQTEANIQARDISLLDKNAGIRYTYEAVCHGLYEQIVKIIDSAQQYVYLASFSIVVLENLPEFCTAITNAIQRNVIVSIFCRGMNFRDDHLAACEWLRAAGCILYGDFYNHSKGIANESLGMLFTANIDGKHGLKTGFEVGCLLNDEQRLAFVQLHAYLIDGSDYVFIENAIRRDFFDTYSRYEQEKNINRPVLPNALIIHKNNNNIADIHANPIFFGRDSYGDLLITGKNYWRCNYKDGVFDVIKKDWKNKRISTFLLKYDTLTID